MDFQIPYGALISLSIIILVIVTIVKSVKIVPQSELYIIERLGKYHSSLSGGLHFIFPFIDIVRNVLTTKEQLINVPKQNVITKDNVNITIDGIVFCKVFNGEAATYNIVDFSSSIASLTQTILRSEIGSMVLDETLSNRDNLNQKLHISLSNAISNWGLQISRVEISDISVPPHIEKSMNLQMEAERTKRAVETKATGDKEAKIREGEAFKQVEVLKAEAIERMADAKKYEQKALAEGQKEAMDCLEKAMKENTKAAEFLLYKDKIQAFKALAESSSKDKVIIPYELSNMMTGLNLVGEGLFNHFNINPSNKKS